MTSGIQRLPSPVDCMTGATVIIIRADGTEAILGKTRCSRKVAQEWFDDPCHRNPQRFESLWADFLVPRVRGCPCPCQDIESTYSDTGFKFPVARLDLPAGALGRELRNEAERRIAMEDSEDGLLARYGDLEILIDLRAEPHP
ncbi:MAG: hypothetical protein P4L36_04125 [Holophaga sp.]|nr:hypothetical protein [Holophaga sp.]